MASGLSSSRPAACGIFGRLAKAWLIVQLARGDSTWIVDSHEGQNRIRILLRESIWRPPVASVAAFENGVTGAGAAAQAGLLQRWRRWRRFRASDASDAAG